MAALGPETPRRVFECPVEGCAVSPADDGEMMRHLRKSHYEYWLGRGVDQAITRILSSAALDWGGSFVGDTLANVVSLPDYHRAVLRMETQAEQLAEITWLAPPSDWDAVYGRVRDKGFSQLYASLTMATLDRIPEAVLVLLQEDNLVCLCTPGVIGLRAVAELRQRVATWVMAVAVPKIYQKALERPLLEKHDAPPVVRSS